MSTMPTLTRRRTPPVLPESILVKLRVSVRMSPEIQDWLLEHVTSDRNLVGAFGLTEFKTSSWTDGERAEFELVLVLSKVEDKKLERLSSKQLIEFAMEQLQQMPGHGLLAVAWLDVEVRRRRGRLHLR